MSKFSLFVFGNPTNKAVIETAYTWELLIAKPYGPIIMIDQSEILNRSHVQFITLFWRCTTLLLLLQATASCINLVRKNQFLELNRHILTSHNKLYCLELHTEHR
jgi:hypothetical protein